MRPYRTLAGALSATLLLAGCASTVSTSPIDTTSVPTAMTGTPTAMTIDPTATPAEGLGSTPVPDSAAGNDRQTIHVVDHPTGGSDVLVGSLTSCMAANCQGDYIVGYDPVVDAATGQDVGTLAYECFLVDPGETLYHCPGNTFTLTGRGQIVFAEVIQHRVGGPPTIAPITGGTGDFEGAVGTVTSQKVFAGGDFVIAFRP